MNNIKPPGKKRANDPNMKKIIPTTKHAMKPLILVVLLNLIESVT